MVGTVEWGFLKPAGETQVRLRYAWDGACNFVEPGLPLPMRPRCRRRVALHHGEAARSPTPRSSWRAATTEIRTRLNRIWRVFPVSMRSIDMGSWWSLRPPGKMQKCGPLCETADPEKPRHSGRNLNNVEMQPAFFGARSPRERLALDCAQGEPGDEPVQEVVVDNRHRQGDQRRRRHQGLPEVDVAPDQLCEHAHAHGFLR
jgi:hypothetical protein